MYRCLRRLKAGLYLFIFPSSLPGIAELNLFIISSSVRCLRQLKAGLNLFIVPSSVPVFEAAKDWAKPFHFS